MKNSINIPFISIRSFIKSSIVFLLAIIISSCNNPSQIGLSVQPPNDKINVLYVDTFSIITKTLPVDSLSSSSSSSCLLGCYVDPVFGKVSGSFYAVPDLQSFNNNIGSNPVADSIVLTLVYDGYYGDLNTTQSVSVYEMEQIINTGTTYYSNQNFAYNNEAIGNLVFTPKPNDSIMIGGVNQVPQLRIKLNNSLANSILNASSTTLSSNAAFNSFFRGIYVKSSDISTSGKGAILYFSLQDFSSGITIYFHNSTSSGLAFNMVFDGSSATVNHFDHNYTNATAINSLNAINDSIVYIQCMAGLKTSISIPFLVNLAKSGKIIINKADLLVYVGDSTNSNLYPPPSNMVLYIDSSGTDISLPDYTVSTFQVPINGLLYDFVLNDYAQRVLTGQITNYNLDLVSALGIAQANRAIIAGAKNPVNPMKLAITYTKL